VGQTFLSDLYHEQAADLYHEQAKMPVLLQKNYKNRQKCLFCRYDL